MHALLDIECIERLWYSNSFDAYIRNSRNYIEEEEDAQNSRFYSHKYKPHMFTSFVFTLEVLLILIRVVRARTQILTGTYRK